ncbi:MAG: hypothetical protein HC900_00065 [Methylacidiphilales bacterium]|nr:hypothetical protein [Candidatus Methylacidiphilales bacterium]
MAGEIEHLADDARREAADNDRALRAVLDTADGKRVVFWLLGLCGLYQDQHATGMADATSYMLGRRSVGLMVINKLNELDARLYPLLMLEVAQLKEMARALAMRPWPMNNPNWEMTTMFKRTLGMWVMALFAPEDGGGSGGGGDAGGGAAPSPESVLFPNEGKGEGGGDKATGPSAGDKAVGQGDAEKNPDDAGKAEWKEYQPDPVKSDEENARLKAERDAKSPNSPDNQVPDDGKYDLKMPDGVELDAELAAALGPEFKGLGLTRLQAQKLTDAYAAVVQDRAAKQAAVWSAQNEKWIADAKADQEIGGPKWDGSVSVAKRALDKFGTPALRDFLLVSGGGNHPEVIRFMARVGNAISEDRPAGEGGGSGAPVDAAHVLFPNDVPKR